MKAIISSTILFLFSFSVNGQVDTSIVGVWKIVSIEMDSIYFNFKKDSISLSGEKKSLDIDETRKKNMTDFLKMVFSQTEFHFEKSGILKQQVMGEIIHGTYKVNTLQNVIEITTKNSLKEDVTDKIKYNLKNGLLYLSMEWDEDEFDLVLEKN